MRAPGSAISLLWLLAAAAHAGSLAPGLPPIPKATPSVAERTAEGRLLYELGAQILATNAWEPAARVLRRAADLLPDLAVAHTALARALVQEGRDLERARQAIARAVVLDPKDATAYGLKGLLYELSGDVNAAFASYYHALRLRPDDPTHLEKLGLLAIEVNRKADAISAFERLLALSPRSSIAAANLAALYEGRGDLTRAEAMLKKLVEIDGTRWVFWQRLADFYRRAGRMTDAERALAEVQRLNPQLPPRPDFRPLKSKMPKGIDEPPPDDEPIASVPAASAPPPAGRAKAPSKRPVPPSRR